jgi:hypothetical protein
MGFETRVDAFHEAKRIAVKTIQGTHPPGIYKK